MSPESGMVLVPLTLTAENGAKAALAGEFHVDVPAMCEECEGGEFAEDGCESCDGGGMVMTQMAIEWTTIKEIWKKAIEHFAAAPASPPTPAGNAAKPCNFRFPISECPNMKEVDGDTSMEYEHYECKVCGKRDKLDYEEMK